ncbi:hypothetical protein [Arcobacter acticola]|uniref:hypothetical protein n=1 Tax=Arcobacter acticola TaxID=1849015 RepID=UPI001552B408|nr:hypothetical protein [Arcobacter acticola]
MIFDKNEKVRSYFINLALITDGIGAFLIFLSFKKSSNKLHIINSFMNTEETIDTFVKEKLYAKYGGLLILIGFLEQLSIINIFKVYSFQHIELISLILFVVFTFVLILSVMYRLINEKKILKDEIKKFYKPNKSIQNDDMIKKDNQIEKNKKQEELMKLF